VRLTAYQDSAAIGDALMNLGKAIDLEGGQSWPQPPF